MRRWLTRKWMDGRKKKERKKETSACCSEVRTCAPTHVAIIQVVEDEHRVTSRGVPGNVLLWLFHSILNTQFYNSHETSAPKALFSVVGVCTCGVSACVSSHSWGFFLSATRAQCCCCRCWDVLSSRSRRYSGYKSIVGKCMQMWPSGKLASSLHVGTVCSLFIQVT